MLSIVIATALILKRARDSGNQMNCGILGKLEQSSRLFLTGKQRGKRVFTECLFCQMPQMMSLNVQKQQEQRVRNDYYLCCAHEMIEQQRG